MDYQKVYDQIVDRAKERTLEDYREKHHIVPKSLGGGNEKSNLVELTAREHFICHWLLHRLHPTSSELSYAFWMMCSMKTVHQKRYKPSSRVYKEGKEASGRATAKRNKGRYIGELNPMFGKTGKDHHMHGVARPDMQGDGNPMKDPRVAKIHSDRMKINNPAHTHRRECEYCRKIIAPHIYVRWHGIKCKQNLK